VVTVTGALGHQEGGCVRPRRPAAHPLHLREGAAALQVRGMRLLTIVISDTTWPALSTYHFFRGSEALQAVGDNDRAGV
jgi:hypothetical protein